MLRFENRNGGRGHGCEEMVGEGVEWQTARKSFETDGVISSRAEGGLNMMVHEGERGETEKKVEKEEGNFFSDAGDGGRTWENWEGGKFFDFLSC